MKIEIVKYNKQWNEVYKEINTELKRALNRLSPRIDHIGSTSVDGLAAKPIIDILAGIHDENQLNETILPMINAGYIYYEMYNDVMPYRRFFVKTKLNDLPIKIIKNKNDIPPTLILQENRIAQIHIIRQQSIHWLRHITFKKYLSENEAVRKQYQSPKEKLSLLDWKDGNEYNTAKNDFIQQHEKIAVERYKNDYN